MPRSKTGPLRKGDRVVATVDLRDIPEGTTGKVMLVNGIGPWLRSWVRFDNGIWMGSISNDKLVRVAEWPQFQVRRAEEAERAKNAPPEPVAVAAAAAPTDAGGDAPASEAASKVPAHLLARSKAARERKAAPASGD
jgi:hypothetical protein